MFWEQNEIFWNISLNNSVKKELAGNAVDSCGSRGMYLFRSSLLSQASVATSPPWPGALWPCGPVYETAAFIRTKRPGEL